MCFLVICIFCLEKYLLIICSLLCYF
jgi:hypothetical protein